MKDLKLTVRHTDFLLEVLPYYEVLEKPVFVFGDPFGINLWCDKHTTLEGVSSKGVSVSKPYFLSEAIQYNDIPIGYRFNDNIRFLFMQDFRYRELTKKTQKILYKAIDEGENTPLPDYGIPLEKIISDTFENFTVSKGIIEIFKQQYTRNALITKMCQNMNHEKTLKASSSSDFLKEIDTMERFLNRDPTAKILDNEFLLSAYRELKKIWVDSNFRVYLWYQGILKQRYNFPLPIHDLLIMVDILHETPSYDKIYPLTSYRVSDAGHFHPHVNTGGSPCTGDNLADLTRYHQTSDLHGLLDTYIQYLNRYTGMGAFRTIDYWLCVCGHFVHKRDGQSGRSCNECGNTVCPKCQSVNSRHTHQRCYNLREERTDEEEGDTEPEDIFSPRSTTIYTLTDDDTGTGRFTIGTTDNTAND